MQAKIKNFSFIPSLSANASHQRPHEQVPNALAANVTTSPDPRTCPSVSRTYLEGFTIHGLSKVFTGRLWERIFWGSVLLGVLGFLAFIVNGFYTKYKGNEFRTEIREVDERNRTWPTIKICSKTAWKEMDPESDLFMDFCYKNQTYIRADDFEEKIVPCKQQDILKISNYRSMIKFDYNHDYVSPATSHRVNIRQKGLIQF